MLRLLRSGAAPLPHLLLMLAGLIPAACSVGRDRPTGPADAVPETTVEVVVPQNDALVPSDSVTRVVIEATGLIRAVEYLLLLNPTRDSLASGRMVLDEPTDTARVHFDVQIPDFRTGTTLEFRGFAEDVSGERKTSDPVLVTVIECNVFMVACFGL